MTKGYNKRYKNYSFYIGVSSTQFGLGVFFDTMPATCYPIFTSVQINILWLKSWLIIYEKSKK